MEYRDERFDDVTPEEGMIGHEQHKTFWAIAGAPGTGKSLHCETCQQVLWSNIRVLEPWEVE
jgi:KaiC/GvpD/RAD55 family RecA-like ATPase